MAPVDREARAVAVRAGGMLSDAAAIHGQRTPGQRQKAAVQESSHEPSRTLPALRWRGLDLERYRAAFKAGELQCGIYVDQPWRHDKPTVVFIHGAAAAPSQFTALANGLLRVANCAAFLWDDKARLAPSAETLRAALLRLPGAVTIVAYSMGTLLPAYLGATDRRGRLRSLAAIYLNPLIGGSRYAGDFRLLCWLGVGSALQRMFCRPSFLDLAPESDFQQAVCGRAGAPSSFAARTLLLFTERPGNEPDVPPARLPNYFGRGREELLVRLGTVVHVPLLEGTGHDAPLLEPKPVLPIVRQLLDRRPIAR